MRLFYLARCELCGRRRLSCRLLAIIGGNLAVLRAWRHWFDTLEMYQ